MSHPHPSDNAEPGQTGDAAAQVARTARQAGARKDIRFVPQAVDWMNQRLPDSQVDAVAGAIARIGRESPDAVLRVTAQEAPAEPYQVMIPHGIAAPVVTYRRLDEEEGLGSGWLVTGLLPRKAFNTYAGDLAFMPERGVS